jgi:hypothetical protein
LAARKPGWFVAPDVSIAGLRQAALGQDNRAWPPCPWADPVTDSGLTHLHPGVRSVAAADNAVRLEAIRSKRWITHDPAARVSASLKETIDQPISDRMENILFLAESGMGKTMLLRKFLRDNTTSFDATRGVQSHPVVLVLMPEEPTEEAFYLQVLKAVGAPLILSPRRHMLSVRETTFRILRELGTRMLMIDEINSILVGSPRQQRRFLQLLRFLSNELQVAIVCAGVPEARFALLSDPQLRSRVAEILLEPWTPDPEFQTFVNILVQGLPLSCCRKLPEKCSFTRWLPFIVGFPRARFRILPQYPESPVRKVRQ